ncbi:thioredoxin-dependent thiol peroxidase [Thermobifida alba]|uniref:thioredoxin-dependent peroxiredoxin n=1 Tax=Thermobifida alba TaxID=53522 RepID=A0ABY4L1N1_THEAE|nr:thioredoxin-dependent thiol peroxidase [Thermobifida alba]UPT21577.1 thioredoxin-dependent thiol peroxidase [Thermobifida alba]
MRENTIRLQPGDTAPDFTLDSADGTPVTLSEVLKEHDRVVLYFYPAAMTPGCTTQACDFRDNLRDFDNAGLAVLGVSPDSLSRLAKFVEQEGLTFPLLSDPDRSVLTSYGAFGEKKNYGRIVQGVIRSTFVVSSGLTVERAYYNVRASGHVDRLRRDLGL